ncbi:TetR/AcrR family transcriptional regulator [Roseovarius pelagicus]|uniref:TetR/AcrR family transcriptional regulator n=1 Tax=Roseovarius pelagicus TaxID=2980108 RepID=A0ABY6DE93_9RHOB|nr:TetR/AcrR family transcriptional regulator [Roseovarius pelagicus]UXX84477.1 TetR/AcrR family transcriptional regulator [Roseovarius pelagicus]
MNKQRTQRLTRQDWLRTGLNALASDGSSALQAEPLARRLGTTKGSFYWHFADLPAFQAELIERWEDEAIEMVHAAKSSPQGDAARLRHYAQTIMDMSASDAAAIFPVEPAIRAWGLSHDGAAAAIRRVDAKRLDHLGSLLGAIGVSNPEMARIIYSASLGMEALGPEEANRNKGAIGSLVDLVLALR